MPQAEIGAIRRNVFLCYFVSGMLGLVYQVLWLRKLLLVFGSSVYAVSAVLTVFFSGLALGSWLLGRLIDRKPDAALRWYGYLEAGIGLYAFITLPLFELLKNLYIPLYRASGLAPAVLVGGALLASMLALLLPATLMGGSFPVISRYFIQAEGDRGVRIADLYALNTAGAMAGVLLIYFFGLPYLGLTRSLMSAGVLSLGIGMLCIVFDRHLREVGGLASHEPALAPAQTAGGEEPGAGWIFTAFALSGFSAIAYEVVWTRSLSLVLGSSIYAFCIILATFLGGMALGSALSRMVLRGRPGSVRQFMIVEALLGAYGILVVGWFMQLPEGFVRLWPVFGGSFRGLMALQWILSGLLMLFPTVLMGFLFPLVSDIVTRRFASLGTRLGKAYAVNTLGGILGSFTMGFVFVPWLGLPWAMGIAGLVNVLAWGLLYGRFGTARPGLRWGVALAGGLAAWALCLGYAVPNWRREVLTSGVFMSPENYGRFSVAQMARGSELLFYRDGLNATVSVHLEGDNLSLRVGGKTDASNGADMATQALSGHIPMLLHPDPKRVAVIGLGSAVTLGSIGRYPVAHIDGIELEAAVVEASRQFAGLNYGIHDDPRVRLIVADGRNFLMATRERYDVISSEPSNPWMAGIGNLFTSEFYELAKQRLDEDGIFCQWLQLYRIFPEDVKLMLKTFNDAFPYVTAWAPLPGDMLLIGSDKPITLTREALEAKLARPEVKEALAVIGIESSAVLLDTYLFNEEAIKQMTADVDWLHRDDLPWMEFNTPRSLYSSGMMLRNSAGLRRFARPAADVVPGFAPPDDAAFYKELANRWLKVFQYADAIKAMRRWAELEPASPAPWRAIAEAAIAIKDYRQAKRAALRVVELDPSDADALYTVAKLAWIENDTDEAAVWYAQAALQTELTPERAEIQARFALERGEYESAVEYFRKAVEAEKNPAAGLIFQYAQALARTERWDRAEEVLRHGARNFPADPRFPLLLGRARLEQGQWEPATEAFLKAGEIAPKEPDVYYGLAQIAREKGLGAQEEHYLKRLLQLDPYHRHGAEMLQALRSKGR